MASCGWRQPTRRFCKAGVNRPGSTGGRECRPAIPRLGLCQPNSSTPPRATYLPGLAALKAREPRYSWRIHSNMTTHLAIGRGYFSPPLVSSVFPSPYILQCQQKGNLGLLSSSATSFIEPGRAALQSVSHKLFPPPHCHCIERSLRLYRMHPGRD